MKAIHCVGVAVVDALSGPIERFPVPRLEPQVTTERVSFLPGGGAVNTASALSRMGLPATVFSKVGKDLMGTFLLKELEKCGVDTSGIRVSEQDASPFTFVGIHTRGDRTFIHTPGANKTLSIEDFDLRKLFDTNYLLYQDLWAMPRLDARSGVEILAMAQKAGVTTLLDECWGFGPQKATFEAMCPHCDFVLPSLDDMLAIYPGQSPDSVLRMILALGPKTVALKMGQEGCVIARGGERIHIPALPADVVDTTGAGDCWNAGFLAGLAHGEDIASAGKIANACAAFGIEAVGGASGVPAYNAVRWRALR